MKSQVIKKITVEELNIEIHSDGDCVIHSEKMGFMQIPPKVIEEIYMAIKSLPRMNPAGTSKVDDLLSVPVAATKAHPDENLIPSEVPPRNIKSTAGGWVCSFKNAGFDPIIHTYESRGLARVAHLNNPIGHAGRVA